MQRRSNAQNFLTPDDQSDRPDGSLHAKNEQNKDRYYIFWQSFHNGFGLMKYRVDCL